jgi:hypothetical protein
MNARPKWWLDINAAAEIVYGWRNPPPVNTAERDRYDEARREFRESRFDYEQEREE